MNDLDTLRPEVRRADSFLDSMACSADEEAAVKTIRAELLRLAGENARLLAANRDAIDHFEQMKAELAALKARIMEAPLHTVSFHIPTGITCIVCDVSMRGQRVRLVVED